MTLEFIDKHILQVKRYCIVNNLNITMFRYNTTRDVYILSGTYDERNSDGVNISILLSIKNSQLNAKFSFRYINDKFYLDEFVSFINLLYRKDIIKKLLQ